jgi:hypothetical protein
MASLLEDQLPYTLCGILELEVEEVRDNNRRLVDGDGVSEWMWGA